MEVKKEIKRDTESGGLGRYKECFSKNYKLHDFLTSRYLIHDESFEKKHKSIIKCGKAVISKDDSVKMDIVKGKSVTLHNLIYCKNPDICPVCGPYEQLKRAKLLKHTIDYAHSNGMTVYMLTLTAPHYFNTDYLAFSKQLQSGYSKLIATIKRMVKAGDLKYNLMGHVQNFEVTYSFKNGYHPHKHCLLFFSAGVNEKELESDLKRIWKKICRKNGLLDLDNADFDQRAVDLRLCETANDYLQKINYEMSNQAVKIAKNNYNITYYQALEMAYQAYNQPNVDYAKLDKIIIGFIKIFDVTESLRFSKGFKAIIENYIDSLPAPAPADEEPEVETITISKTTWDYIVRHKLRPDLITKAIEGGADKVRLWLAMLGFRLRYSLYDCAIGA